MNEPRPAFWQQKAFWIFFVAVVGSIVTGVIYIWKMIHSQ